MSDEGTLNLTALLPELEIHSYTDAHSIEIRPPLVCKDGFTMQIMVGERYYCTPQENGLPNYTHYEIHIHEDAPELAEYLERKPVFQGK